MSDDELPPRRPKSSKPGSKSGTRSKGKKKSSGKSTGLIIGLVVGGVFFLICAGGAFWAVTRIFRAAGEQLTADLIETGSEFTGDGVIGNALTETRTPAGGRIQLPAGYSDMQHETAGTGEFQAYRSPDNPDGTYNLINVASDQSAGILSGNAELAATSQAFFQGMESSSGVTLSHSRKETGTLGGLPALRIQSTVQYPTGMGHMVSLFLKVGSRMVIVNGVSFVGPETEQYRLMSHSIHSWRPN